MPICPNCQHENAPGTENCLSCGERLTQQAPVAPSTSAWDFTPPPVSQPAQVPVTPPQQYNPPPAFEPVPITPPTYPNTYNPPVGGMPVYPTKSRMTALMIELVGGFFGIYGIGRLYAGEGGGVGWLIAGLIWVVIAFIIAVATASIGAICTVPITWLMLIADGVTFNNLLKAHPEKFR